MCGFAGLFRQAPQGREAIRTQVERMASTLRHRGPDDDGSWVDPSGRVGLAFRRLAILDLSPAGRQPMESPSGRLQMVFNGEVYNFAELRRALEKEGVGFRGTSDSEVILAAFDRWGLERTLPRLIGMFAIGLWDRESEELLLIRDRMGIKPLYVARTPEGVAFGSELAPILEAPSFHPTLDMEALSAYLRYLFIPAPRTPFTGVAKLPPGHLLRLTGKDLRTEIPSSRSYWSVEETRRGALVSGEDAVADLEALLSDAVRRRLVADVPVGALLSGGVDSSLIVALMARESSQKVRTFTIGFDSAEHDETPHARAVARHLGTEHTELPVSGDDALQVVPSLPRIFDEPLADPSQLPTFLVSRLARQQVTVALSGDGGDELFGGYNRYTSGLDALGRLTRLPARSRRWMGAAIRAVPPSAWTRVHGLLGGAARGVRLPAEKAQKLGRMLEAGSAPEMYGSLLCTGSSPGRLLDHLPDGGVWDPILAALHGRTGGLVLGDLLEVDQRYYLPDDLLQKVDRASMAVSLEVRVPLLDHRVVEFSWTLPDAMKVRNGEGKWILRRILERHLPRTMLDRPKTGFSVPVSEWLRGPLRPWAESLLLDRSPARDHLFRGSVVQERWRSFTGGRSELALELWAVLMLEAWRREWRVNDVREAA